MGIIIRQSIKGTIVTYIGVFLGFLTTMFLVTKFLTPEEVGLTKLLLDSSNLFCSLALLGITISAVRYFPNFKSDNGRNNGFFFYLMAIPFIGLVIILPFLAIFKEHICKYLNTNSSLFVSYYYWMIPLTLFCVYLTVFETYSSLLMRVAVPRFIREVLLRILLIIVYILYALKFLNLTNFITAYVAVYGIAMFVTFFYVSSFGSVSLKHDYKFITPQLKRSFFTYTIFLIIGSLGGNIVGRIDILMLSSQKGLVDTGIYAIAYFMAAIIEIPSRSILPISSPIVSQAISSKDFAKANSLFKDVSLHQLLAGGFIFILIWINIDNIYKIIPNGDDYYLGKWVVFYIGISRLIQATLGFGGTIIQYSTYYKWELVFILTLSILAIYSNYLLIPVYGVVGSAIATMITYFVCFSLQQVLLQLKMRLNPFSLGTIKTLGIMGFMLLTNYFLPTLESPYFDITTRSLITSILALALTYFFNVSKDVNNLVHKTLNLIKNKL